MKGLLLAEAYYQDHGEPLLRKRFPQLMDRLAIGLVGSGSECFGFDDHYSRDHNWGPSFCIWLTDDDYDRFGADLIHAYDSLPQSYQGIRAHLWRMGKNACGDPFDFPSSTAVIPAYPVHPQLIPSGWQFPNPIWRNVPTAKYFMTLWVYSPLGAINYVPIIRKMCDATKLPLVA